ncbi:MAG: N-acetylmuramoyl-L-alanine amidase family protein [Acidobacteriaceae bacterium]
MPPRSAIIPRNRHRNSIVATFGRPCLQQGCLPPDSSPGRPRISLAPISCLAALCTCLVFAAAAPAQHVNISSRPPQSTNFTVVVDAAHGGSDLGAQLSPTLNEKSVTLTLALRLRSLLAAHGIATVITRTGDTNIPMATRAGIANHAHAAACVLLHATATGVGIHLFTSSLAPGPPTAAPAWDTAQSAYIHQSIRLSSDIDAAFDHTRIPTVVGRTFLQPLDNLTCPAIAIELAPKPSSGMASAKSVDDPAYQAAVLNAILAGILQWQQDWSRHP